MKTNGSVTVWKYKRHQKFLPRLEDQGTHQRALGHNQSYLVSIVHHPQ